MVDPSVPPLRLQLDLDPEQPGLLEGLEAWLRLGLLSEAQVLALAQTQLACALPPASEMASVPPLTDSTTSELPTADIAASPELTDFLPPNGAEEEAEEAIFRTLLPPPSRTGHLLPGNRRPTEQRSREQTAGSPSRGRDPSPTGVWLNRLMSELSVVWLLGLGVFLVVLSSAVLAATQWARFNAVGQYLVLLAYTLAFWLVGLLCGRGENLQLTAKTLGMITLLLVPLNFWAMDALGVWASSGGRLLGLVAAGILSLVAVQDLRQKGGSALEQGNTLGLAYLHTGWSLAGSPLLAVYLSVLGSAAVTMYRQRHLAPRPPSLGEIGRQRPTTLPNAGSRRSAPQPSPPTANSGSHLPSPPFHWPTLTLGISLGLLLLRAITQTSPSQWGQFGFAFGLYAATWVWLGQRHLSPAPTSQASADFPQSSDASTVADALDSTLSASPHPPLPASPNPLTRWPILLGRLLLIWSWLLTISDWLAQAFGISALGLGLRLQALQRLGKRRDLLMAYIIAVQIGFVGWEVLPVDWRQAMLEPLMTGLVAVWWPTALLGISLFPYVVAMVALGDWYYRRNQPRLGGFSDGIALGSNLLLTLVSIPVGRVLVVNLIASTLTAFVLAGRRTPRRQSQILLSYGLTLATIFVTIGQRWPQWPRTHWLTVITALAVVVIVLSKALPNLWGKSAWFYSLGLAAATYGLLWWHLLSDTATLRSPWTILGLAIPIAFALVGRSEASVPTTPLSLLFTLGMPQTRLIGLATATVLSTTHSATLHQPPAPFLTVTYGLGLIVALVDRTLPTFPRHWTDWYGLTAALTLLLWATWRLLPPSPRDSPRPTPDLQPSGSRESAVGSRENSEPDSPLPTSYSPLPLLCRTACDQWGHILLIGTLIAMTFYPHWVVTSWMTPDAPPRIMPVVGVLGILLALALRYWQRVQPEAIYLAGWAVQLGVAEAMAWRWGSPLELAVPTLGLGALSLLLATGLARMRSPLAIPLQRLTLAYAGLALVLRSYTATAWTGWLVVGASLLILEIGRQGRQPLSRWLALVGLSVGWYELVLYQMLQAPTEAVADGLTGLAGVAALIMAVYRLAAARLQRWDLPPEELIWAAHLHWLTGSGLMLVAGLALSTAGGTGETAKLAWVGVAVAATLVIYALGQGRWGDQTDLKSAWVYGGLVEWVGWFALVRLAASSLAVLDDGWGVVACVVAVPVYWTAWSSWGWPQRPWRVMAVIVPLTVTLLTQGTYHVPTLWVLVGFYGWLAWHSGKVRVSYLSVGLAVWAVGLWLDQRAIQDPVLNLLSLSLALLYVAQLDPVLRSETGKTARHWLRVAAISLVLVTALVLPRWAGGPVGAISLGLLAAGLLLRIRAFLYVGTLVFALNALNQLVLLNAVYPLMKWVLGIAVGVALIWVAADFERRRSQWLHITQTWLDNLDGWQ